MDRIGAIRLSFYKCTDLMVPNTFNRQDVRFHKRNICCFGSDILHFNKRWLMEKTNLPEKPAIKALLRGLKSTDVNFSILQMGFTLKSLLFFRLPTYYKCFALVVRSVQICTPRVMLKTSMRPKRSSDKFKNGCGRNVGRDT